MLSFFRKIRKSLLDNNSTRRYILYAIGEIALVVMGILIALQLNNWNEWRKERIKEQKVLTELIETLETNKTILNDKIDRDLRRITSSEIILNAIENQLPYVDSLSAHFWDAQIQGVVFFLNDAGYEGLRNAGFDIIQSDPLRKKIIQLFETTYSEMQEFLDYYKILQPARDIHIDESFQIMENSLKPNNYEELFKDKYYIGFTKRIRQRTNSIIELERICLDQTQKVLQLIKKELKSGDPE